MRIRFYKSDAFVDGIGKFSYPKSRQGPKERIIDLEDGKVTLTYEAIRVSPDDACIGGWDAVNGCWVLIIDGEEECYSEIEIMGDESCTPETS